MVYTGVFTVQSVHENNSLSMQMSSADDKPIFFFQKFSKFKFSLQYLDSSWKIHSNEYKQDFIWFSGF